MKQVILLIHPVQAPIGLAEAEAAVNSSYPSCQIVARIEFTDTRDAWQRAPEKWEPLANAQRVEFSSKLLPVLLANPSAILAYFGVAPIPLILDLAVKVGSTRPISVFQKHHTTKDWAWIQPTGRKAKPRLNNLPGVPLPSGGDVVLRVSTSGTVSAQSTRQVVPKPLLEVEIAADSPGVDTFVSQDEVFEFAESVHEVLSRITELVPAPSTIHMFGAIQCGVAFAIGSRIEKTRHHQIQSYQFSASSQPQYQPAIRLSSPRPGRSLGLSWPVPLRSAFQYLSSHHKTVISGIGLIAILFGAAWAYRDGRLSEVSIAGFGLKLSQPKEASPSQQAFQGGTQYEGGSRATYPVTAGSGQRIDLNKVPEHFPVTSSVR